MQRLVAEEIYFLITCKDQLSGKKKIKGGTVKNIFLVTSLFLKPWFFSVFIKLITFLSLYDGSKKLCNCESSCNFFFWYS